MSDETYEEPQLTQKSDNTDVKIGHNDASAYVNCCPTRFISSKPENQATEQNLRRKSLVGAAAVFLVLLCLGLLAAVIVLGIENKEGNQLRSDVVKLTSEREELQTNYSEMTSINHNLTELTSLLEDEKELLEGMNNYLIMERDQLQTDYNEIITLNYSLTQANGQLMNENNRLITERDELKAQIEARCPSSWIKFENSCYFISTTMKSWTESRNICEDHGADLVIISNIREQEFFSSLKHRVWIGLTKQTENSWKWVNGEAATTTYWHEGQPDNFGSGEDCVEIHSGFPPINNWNDRSCDQSVEFSCEKTLQ